MSKIEYGVVSFLLQRGAPVTHITKAMIDACEKRGKGSSDTARQKYVSDTIEAAQKAIKRKQKESADTKPTLS